MPSNLPSIKVRTEEDTIIKLKAIAKHNKRSLSKEVERLILKHIWDFEQKNGEIQIDLMSPNEIAEDIKDRIVGNPPYGEDKKAERSIFDQ